MNLGRKPPRPSAVPRQPGNAVAELRDRLLTEPADDLERHAKAHLIAGLLEEKAADVDALLLIGTAITYAVMHGRSHGQGWTVDAKGIRFTDG